MDIKKINPFKLNRLLESTESSKKTELIKNNYTKLK
jgi:hypothetical protein